MGDHPPDSTFKQAKSTRFGYLPQRFWCSMQLRLRVGVVGQRMGEWSHWDLPYLFNMVSSPSNDSYRWTVTATSNTTFEAQFPNIQFEILLAQEGIVDIQLVSHCGLEYDSCTVPGTNESNIGSIRCTVPLRGKQLSNILLYPLFQAKSTAMTLHARMRIIAGKRPIGEADSGSRKVKR